MIELVEVVHSLDGSVYIKYGQPYRATNILIIAIIGCMKC